MLFSLLAINDHTLISNIFFNQMLFNNLLSTLHFQDTKFCRRLYYTENYITNLYSPNNIYLEINMAFLVQNI